MHISDFNEGNFLETQPMSLNILNIFSMCYFFKSLNRFVLLFKVYSARPYL